MRKNIFSIVMATVMAAFLFVSCEKESTTAPSAGASDGVIINTPEKSSALKAAGQLAVSYLDLIDGSIPSYFDDTYCTSSYSSSENYSYGSGTGSIELLDWNGNLKFKIDTETPDYGDDMVIALKPEESGSYSFQVHCMNYTDETYTRNSLWPNVNVSGEQWNYETIPYGEYIDYLFENISGWDETDDVGILLLDAGANSDCYIDFILVGDLEQTATPTISGPTVTNMSEEDYNEAGELIETFSVSSGYDQYIWESNGSGDDVQSQSSYSTDIIFYFEGQRTISCAVRDDGKAWSNADTHGFTFNIIY